MSVAWTDEETALLFKAVDIYENSWTLIKEFEFKNSHRSSKALEGKYAREDGVNPFPELSENITLFIENYPDVVLERIRESGHSTVPKYLKDYMKESLEAEESDDDLYDEIFRLETENRTLRDKNLEVNRKFERIKREESMFRALSQEIETHVSPFPFPKNFKPVDIKSNITEEDVVCLFSDAHADEVVDPEKVLGFEEYNFHVFCRRFEKWIDTIIDWTQNHLPAHSFPRLWIFGLGDNIQGENHKGGDRAHTHFQNMIKAALAVGDVLSSGIRDLTPYFSEIIFVGVPGNHPRTNKFIELGEPHQNFDYLVYAHTATRLQNYIDEGVVSILAPESYQAVCEVRGYNFLLSHGNEVNSYKGIPYYGLERRGRRLGALFRDTMPLHYWCLGHYHTSSSLSNSPSGETFMNGAFPASDDYAFTALGLAGVPSQLMFGVHEKYGATWRVPIYLKDPEGEDLSKNCRYGQRILDTVGKVDVQIQTGGGPVISIG